MQKQRASDEKLKEPTDVALKMGLMETALALVATYIGVGFLGVPYAYSELGFAWALSMTSVVTFITIVSFYLYMQVNELTPGSNGLLYEITYIIGGRIGIFIVCLTIFLRVAGGLVINYIVVGETLSSLAKQAYKYPDEEDTDFFVRMLTN